jgi:hypothetical protein
MPAHVLDFQFLNSLLGGELNAPKLGRLDIPRSPNINLEIGAYLFTPAELSAE